MIRRFSLVTFLLLFCLRVQIVSANSFTDLQISKFSKNTETLCIHYTPVLIKFSHDVITAVTCQKDSQKILLEQDIDIDQTEILKDSFVDNVRQLEVVPIVKTRIIKWEKVPFDQQIEYSIDMRPGTQKIIQKGKDGKRGLVIEQIIYSNGKKKLKTISKWIEKDPTKSILRIGSSHPMKKVYVDGKTIWYWKALKVLATSYDSSCKGCNNYTATGAYLKKGIVAVDPRVIPMHTKMYIPGYGYGQAEDTGGAIKGNRIDLGFADVRYGNWSRRWVTIYLIN